MNKNVLIGGVVVILILAGFLLMSNSNDSEEAVDESATESMAEEEMMDDAEVKDTDSMSDDEMSDEEMMDDAVEADQVITLDGTNYEYSQTEITVKEGETVEVVLNVTEGFHDWVVDEFDAATEQVSEGETTTVTFVASEAGEYEFYCSVGNHRELGMVGTLIVE